MVEKRKGLLLPSLAIILSETLFGFSMFFARMGLAVVKEDSIKFLAFRFTVGFLFMTLLLALKVVHASYRGKEIGLLLICGLCNPMISQALETTALTCAPTTQNAIITSTMPIMMIVLGVLFFREKVRLNAVAFAALSVAGVLMTQYGDVGGTYTLGLVLNISAVTVASLSRLFMRRAREQFTAFEAVYVTTGMGALTFWAVTLSQHGIQGDLGSFFTGLWCPDFIISVLYMGIGSCVFAFMLMSYSAAYLPVEIYAVFITICTVVGIWAGVFLLGEPFRLVDVIGTAIILIGVVGTNICHSRKQEEPCPEQEAVTEKEPFDP